MVTAVNISSAHVNLILKVEGSLRHYPTVACSGNPSGQIGTCSGQAVLKTTDTSAQCTNSLSNQGVPGSFRSFATGSIIGSSPPILGEGEQSNCPSVMPNFGF